MHDRLHPLLGRPLKRPLPGTFAAVTGEVMDVLGDAVVAEICGVAPRTLSSWRDPDAQQLPHARHMLAMDRAMVEAGYEPLFYRAYSERLGMAGVPHQTAAPQERAAEMAVAMAAFFAATLNAHPTPRQALDIADTARRVADVARDVGRDMDAILGTTGG